MSLSPKILLALVFGILFGLFVGEIAAPLKVVGDAFIQLLQMTDPNPKNCTKRMLRISQREVL